MDRETLIKALEKTYGKSGMLRRDIEELSDFILSFFGYDDYILDNVLSSAERDIFYNLEEFGFVEPYREEVSIIKGRAWRINQWKYRKEKILQIVNSKNDDSPKEGIYEEIFRQLEEHRETDQ
ncbi:MAG: hypothetical protein M1315_04210 [Candidatus Thermoplasmatota archaeon]|jgi:hypothetical protein|nr:hypothetical protein [Candidatus Thermoplasmatota archaeon]